MNSPQLPTVAVLMTCFNRRAQTLRSLRSLDQANAGAARLSIVLVDDGSSDGTSDAVTAEFSDATVISGDGSLFWNGGMRRAWSVALQMQPDFYLWLNDDTELRPRAIEDLLALYYETDDKRTIVVGHTVDPNTGALTYGGYVRKPGAWSKLQFVRPSELDADCDTMNGNCVLFPASAAADIGTNSEYYRHAFGDNDYGLRAKRAGYRIRQLAVPVAKQERNLGYEQATRALTLTNWRRILFHPKGVPMREWYHFCREHGGRLWPANFVFRYLKMAGNGLR